MQGLRECLTNGQFVLTAELEPPKGNGQLPQPQLTETRENWPNKVEETYR